MRKVTPGEELAVFIAGNIYDNMIKVGAPKTTETLDRLGDAIKNKYTLASRKYCLLSISKSAKTSGSAILRFMTRLFLVAWVMGVNYAIG